MPAFRIEERWGATETSYWYSRGVWCLIDEQGLPYAVSTTALGVDERITALGGGSPRSGGYTPDVTLTRRSPPGTDEEAWLREHDPRHPGYQGI